MAEPKLELDRRLDRIELAISMMAMWLVQAQTGFSAQDASRIERILRGEKSEEKKDASSEEQGRI
jgi:hypothetical protein